MTTFYDGKNVYNIQMTHWNGTGYDPDWENDFFDIGSLEQIDSPVDTREVGYRWYLVDDCDYLVEQATDCINHRGDYDDGNPVNDDDTIIVDKYTYSEDTGLTYVSCPVIAPDTEKD